MLHGTVIVNGASSAMMVGEKKSLIGDDLSGASSPENHDGVFQARAVDAVNILGCQFKPQLGHFRHVQLFQERKQPHSLICPEGRGQHE